jgi:uncharacterized repeat protein (TIGR01451 family)
MRPWVTVAAVALLAAGCSHNPGYFPFLLPGGPVAQTHAKPGGLGYFRNFDPKACRLELTPGGTACAPVGAQIVLVATVYDKDDTARRDRRVEWVVEGPGNIIEADETGVWPARGYKVDNKYAVSYTSYVSRTITRGNDDPKDNVEICPGQTFCVVSSAVAGETTVTAYAPGVHDWDQGRRTMKITWGDGRFAFPPPATVRFGGEHTLTTTVTRFGSDGPNPPVYRVRYRVLGLGETGAVLAARNSTPGGTAQEIDTAVEVNGEASVTIRQQGSKAGKTRVGVEVIEMPASGVGTGNVVAKRETVVEWAAPQVKLTVAAPPAAPPGGSIPVTVSLANVGPVENKDARVKVSLSNGATLERSDPPPVKQEGGALVFDLPPLAGGKAQAVTLAVRPAGLGPVTVTATAATADGLTAEERGTVRVEPGQLRVVAEAPGAVLTGERLPVRVTVRNVAAAPAANAVVWARFDAGLNHESGKNPVEVAVGALAPGEAKTVEVPLTGKQPGRFAVRATATADGNVSAAADPVAVEVRKAELAVAVAGPTMAYPNQDFAWAVTLTNPGEAAITNVVVRATLPPEVKLKEASDGGRAEPGSVEWRLADLKPNDRRTLNLTVTTTKITDKAAVSVLVTGDALGRDPEAKPVGDPVEARGTAAVAVIGTPAVTMELATPSGAVAVGKPSAFLVRVRNRGSVAARGVEVTAVPADGLKPTRGTGPSAAKVEGGKLVFPPLDELKPGEVVTFTVEVEGTQPGDTRLRAEVKAAHLTSPLKEEQPVRVVGK